MKFKLLEQHELIEILPLAHELNPGIDIEVLTDRLKEMISQNYQCLGAYMENEIIGICGFWITTRFYCGKQIEVDNVIVCESKRSSGLGKKMMAWVYDYARSIDCQTCELNTYATNYRSHKFYYNEGFETLGFHMQKKI